MPDKFMKPTMSLASNIAVMGLTVCLGFGQATMSLSTVGFCDVATSSNVEGVVDRVMFVKSLADVPGFKVYGGQQVFGPGRMETSFDNHPSNYFWREHLFDRKI